jgi:phage terminase small subunit
MSVHPLPTTNTGPLEGSLSVLDNAKHELFAQAIAKGQSGREAYKAAGYVTKTDDVADAAASRLLRDVRVEARVKEILAGAAEQAGVTASRVIAELARIGFADIRKVVSWRAEVTTVTSGLDEGGTPKEVLQSRVTVLDSTSLSDDTAAAVAEVSQSANGSLRIKMHDKPAALEKLGRMLGIFKDRIEHTGPNDVPLKARSELEIGRRLAYVLELIARGEVKAKLPDQAK